MRLFKLLGKQRGVLDVDATLVECHSEKEAGFRYFPASGSRSARRPLDTGLGSRWAAIESIWTRQHQRLGGLVHHTDAGSQYLAIRYADTLTAAGAVASVGSVGDYDNALAESTIGQIKAELVHRRGPWRTLDQLEYAIFEYLDWWDHRRLHGEIGMITPAETEATYYRQIRPLKTAGSQ